MPNREEFKPFTIVMGKGFAMTFENGWSISVQWGPGNYCENRDDTWGTPKQHDLYGSNNAEVAVIAPNGILDDDSVVGYQSTNEILAIMVEVANRA